MKLGGILEVSHWGKLFGGPVPKIFKTDEMNIIDAQEGEALSEKGECECIRLSHLHMALVVMGGPSVFVWVLGLRKK